MYIHAHTYPISPILVHQGIHVYVHADTVSPQIKNTNTQVQQEIQNLYNKQVNIITTRMLCFVKY